MSGGERQVRPVAAAIVVVLALLVAACGGDDDTSTTTTTTAGASSTTEPADRGEVLAACDDLGGLLTPSGSVDPGDVEAFARQLTSEADAIDAWVVAARARLGDASDPLTAPVARLEAANELFRTAIAQLEGVDDVDDVSVAADVAFVAAAQKLVDAGAAVNGVLDTDCFPGAGRTPPPDSPVAAACGNLTQGLTEARARVQESTVGSVRAWVTLTRAAHVDWAAAVRSRPPADTAPGEWDAAVSETVAAADDLFGRAEAVVEGRADDEQAGDEVIQTILAAPETEQAYERYRAAAATVNDLVGTSGPCFEGL